MVGVGNSVDLGPAWLMQEAKRGGTVAVAIRSEIVLQPPPPVFLNINPKWQDGEQGGAAL